MTAAPAAPASTPAAERRDRSLRFDRNELSGAFGDVGTDVPLIVGMLLAAHLDAASVLVMFGLMQVLTGLLYRMPMPVQPLKAVAAIVITQQVAPDAIYGGGLAIGALMLLLALTGALDWLARVIPVVVIRGLQAGLGLQLSLLALRDFVPSQGIPGFILAAVAGVVVLALLGNRRFPPALFVIALGVAWALLVQRDTLAVAPGLALPRLHVPRPDAIVTGFLLLALPQIPLSLGNSVLATRQLAADLFPNRPSPSIRKIGLTYAFMNLVVPWFGGIPVCHGSGGMAGHYAMGGRTGGSVIIYGGFFLLAGLLFAGHAGALVALFPRPILGVLLAVEGLALLALLRDVAGRREPFALALLVAILAVGLPWGYLVAMVVGALLAPLVERAARTH